MYNSNMIHKSIEVFAPVVLNEIIEIYSIKNGYFPNELKIAKLSVIHKKGHKSSGNSIKK